MSEERDDFRAWLDRGTPNPQTQHGEAERIWSSRRVRPRWTWMLAAATAAALGLWWFRPSAPAPQPQYQSRLLVSVADDEIRIEVGVRRKQDR